MFLFLYFLILFVATYIFFYIIILDMSIFYCFKF